MFAKFGKFGQKSVAILYVLTTLVLIKCKGLFKIAKFLNVSELATSIIIFFILLMINVAKSETLRNFTILNKALLFSTKLDKTSTQSEPNFSVRVQIKTLIHSYNHFFNATCQIRKNFGVLYYSTPKSFYLSSD